MKLFVKSGKSVEFAICVLSYVGQALSGADLDKLQILKQNLDEGNQKILDEIMKEKDETNEQEKENVKSELEKQHREELNSLKATAEAVYSSQLDEQLARSEHEKSQALVEQLEELHQRHEGEMEQMRKDYEEAVMEKEEQYQSMIKDTNGKFISVPLHFACSLLLGLSVELVYHLALLQNGRKIREMQVVSGRAGLGWAEGQSGS
ncbi:hypothetical protein BSL78_24501 [Apostichopus japonicus]|uniref:Uncharacterized protein n=1 Tax=Stichopus japonicus TaxID=307972 RepID=A0A2G8JSB1_STIJA|nr:hypothetical protein BSL78_24501 [Apostichopus japonicus]